MDESSSSAVTIRAEPSDQARSVATVPPNEVVRVIDSTRDAQKLMWYRVRPSSGTEGWVRGQFKSLDDFVTILQL